MYFLLALPRLNFISLIWGSPSTTAMVVLPPLPAGFSLQNFLAVYFFSAKHAFNVRYVDAATWHVCCLNSR